MADSKYVLVKRSELAGLLDCSDAPGFKSLRAALSADQVEAVVGVVVAHHPVGAYHPVGQLDGDCSCGRGEWSRQHLARAVLGVESP